MPTAFERAFAIVVGAEGGYVNNPADPGGETRFGVSKRSYPDVDIVNLTLAQAQAIYKRDFWDPIRGDDLPPTLALLALDAAINSGPSRAARWLQAAVGVAQDGKIGPATLAAVHAHKGHGADVQAEFMAQRMNFMANLATWRSFGLGWSRRLARLPYLTASMVDDNG